MSRLKELIEELCPDGVEYKALKDVCEIRSGWGFPVSEQGHSSGEYPFYKVGDMNLPENRHFMTIANNYISRDVSKNLSCNPAPKGTTIFPKIGAAIKTNKKRLLTIPSCYDNNVMGIIPAEKLIPEFLFYIFDSITLINFADYSGAMPSIRKSTVGKYCIPVPPLPVQQEIVRILDTFTDLTAELQEELQARKKQYEYYRNELLKFKSTEIEYRKLGEVCSVKGRIGWQRLKKSEYLTEGNYYLVTGTDIRENRVDFNSCYYVSKDRFDMDANIQLKNGDIILTKDGTIGKVALIEGMNKPAVLNSHLFVIRDCSKKLNSKFLMHVLLSNEFENFVRKNQTKGTIPGLTQATIVKFEIPIPSMEVQNDIVKILDQFDSLCNDLTSGLPAEIESRRKQYEYYRDKLLTFPRKN